jgi:hypothetical protein
MPIILKGATSGQVTLDTPAIAGTNNLELPAATGTIQLLKLETSQATTSGTSKDFLNIPSWAKKITVMFNNTSTAATASAMLIQIGFGSIENTGYSSGAGYSSGSGTNTITSTAGFIINNNNAATTFTANVLINLISGSTYICSHSGFDIGIGNAFMVGGGSKTTTAIIDRLRITTVSGTATFDAGSVNILIEGN